MPYSHVIVTGIRENAIFFPLLVSKTPYRRSVAKGMTLLSYGRKTLELWQLQCQRCAIE